MTSSSQLDNTHNASHGRLYGNHSWCSSTQSNTQYIQINLGQVMTVTGIATQGDHTMDKWVTTYTISYSMDGILWNTYKDKGNSDKQFQGNSDKDNVRVQWLSHPLTARHVRVTPQTWNTAICMRIELYGCDYATRPLISGMTNQNLTASANTYVDLVCVVHEPLIQYIKWYTVNTDITSQSTGLVRGANGVKQSILRVNYTSVDDVLINYECIRSETVLCFKAFVCRASYEEHNKHPTVKPNAGVTGRIAINETSSSLVEANADGFKSAGVTVMLDYPTTLAAPTVNNIKSTFVSVRWNQPALKASQAKVTSYVLDYQSIERTHSVSLKVPPPASTYVITGLAIFTNYSVKIRAVSRIGPGQWSTTTNFTTDSSLPVASPLLVTAKGLTSETIRVTWQAPKSGINGPILGYIVVFTSVSLSPGEATGNLTTKQTHCIIGNLLKWTGYNIRVSVFNDKGEGPAAYVTESTLEDAPSQPPQFFNVTVISSTSVLLSWELPPINCRNGIIRGFEISYKKTIQNENATVLNLYGNGTLRHVLDGLEKYMTYTFKVLSYTNEKSSYSKSIKKTTFQDAPTVPKNLQTSVIPPKDLRGPQMNITWDEPHSPNGIIQSYTVFCNSTFGSSVVHLFNERNVTLPVIGGLRYSCSVKAKTIKFGNETRKTIFVQIYAPTTAPQNENYSETNATTFIVTWQPLNTTNGPVTIYELIIQNSKQINQIALRSEDLEESRDEYKNINATCCQAILYELSPCSVYVISIRAYSQAGPGPVSKPIKTVAPEPGPPRRLHVSNVGKRKVKLKWDKPDSLIRTVIEYKISFNGTNLWEKGTEVHRGQKHSAKESAIISGLNPSTHYEFQVFAKTECGAGKMSRVAAVNTSVDAPPPPQVEYVTSINESISNIPLWKASNVNGMIRAYQVIVLEIRETSDSSFDAAKLTDYYKAKENGLAYYIAAQISATHPDQIFQRKFTLGDENVYKTFKNVKLVRGKSYHVFQRAMTLDREKKFLAGKASWIGKGKIHESGGTCIVIRPSQKITKSNAFMYLKISLAFNAVFFVIFIIALFYIKGIKSQYEAKGPESSEITASTTMQAVYENPNADGAEEGLAMTYLSQARNSDYEQIDLINSEVIDKCTCNTLYQSVIEDEGRPELDFQQEKPLENNSNDSKQMSTHNGLQKVNHKPVTRACKSLYQSIHFEEEEGQPKLKSGQGKEMESPLKGDKSHEYQGLQEECKGKYIQATAYQSLQKEQHQPLYVNRNPKKSNQEAAKNLTAYPCPQNTQATPVYQSLDEDFKQSMAQLPAYQSLTKRQAEYVNHIDKDENSNSQPANYQALQQGHTNPSYQSLQAEQHRIFSSKGHLSGP